MKEFIKGFTMVELMIVLALAAILALIATPELSAMIRNNRMKSQIVIFGDSLDQARSEAVKRSLSITVCKSSDGAACLTTGDYSQGWIVFIDNGATVGTVETGELVLQVQQALHSTLSLVGSGSSGSDIADFVTYGADGTTRDIGDAKLCADLSGNHGKTVRVGASGRNRLISESSCP